VKEKVDVDVDDPLTSSEAEAGAPLTPCAVVTAPVVLACKPEAAPATWTENVQLAPGASIAPERLIALVPCVELIVPPPQEPAKPGGVATTSPLGNMSENAIPVNVVCWSGLRSVNDKDVDPPRGIDAAPNPFTSFGGSTAVTVAVLVLPGPASEPTVTVFVCGPACVAVTLRVTLQTVLASSMTPERLTVEDPASAVVVPPQPSLNPFGVATTSPNGRLSVNLIPLIEAPPSMFGFPSMNVSDVFPLTAIMFAPNALDTVGGEANAGAASAPQPTSAATTEHTKARSRLTARPPASRPTAESGFIPRRLFIDGP
jgi:hypothetical protein